MNLTLTKTIWWMPLSASEKLVLLAFAYHVREGETSTSLSHQALSMQVGLSRRHIQRLVKSLVMKGVLTQEGFGPGGANQYVIHIPNFYREPGY